MATSDCIDKRENVTDEKSLFCDLCSADSEHLAEVYCSECQQHLCSACHMFHKRSTATKEHHVVTSTPIPKRNRSSQRYKGDIEERPKRLQAKEYYDSNNLKCKLHQNEILNYFCKDHKTVTCNTCNLIDHRSCSRDTISDIIGKSDFENKLQNTKRDAQNLLDKFKGLMAKYLSYPSATQESKSKFIKEITELYTAQGQQVTSQLAELETIFSTEVTSAIENFTNRKAEIRKTKSAIEKQMTDYMTLFNMTLNEKDDQFNKAERKQPVDYKKLVNAGSTPQKRVMTMILESDIKRNCEQIEDIRRNCFTVTTEGLLEKMGSFDQKVSDVYQKDITIAVKRPLKDKTVKLIGEVRISSTDNKSKIVGMEVLPGRKLLICDQTQQQIVLLEIDYHNNLHLRTLSSVRLHRFN